jgi:hypothetical protein
MPPHESARDMNRTMFGVLALLTMIVAVLAAAVGDVGRQFEEERPPIIVHNGSIVFEPQPIKPGASRGNWVGSGSLWRHDHPAGAPKMLQVTITPSGNVCKDPAVQKLFSQPTGNPITIAYGPSSNDFQQAVVSIVKQNLQVDFGKNPPVHDDKTQRLIAYSTNSQVQILRAVVDKATCEFTTTVSLTIRQMR